MRSPTPTAPTSNDIASKEKSPGLPKGEPEKTPDVSTGASLTGTRRNRIVEVPFEDELDPQGFQILGAPGPHHK
jgi:hypothetical protein